jgi:hypothetical protein
MTSASTQLGLYAPNHEKLSTPNGENGVRLAFTRNGSSRCASGHDVSRAAPLV